MSDEPGLIHGGTDIQRLAADRTARQEAGRLGGQPQDDDGAALSKAASLLAQSRHHRNMSANMGVLPEGSTDHPNDGANDRPPLGADTHEDVEEILSPDEASDDDAVEAEEDSEVAAEAEQDATEDEPAEVELEPYTTAEGEIYLSEDAKAYVSGLERKVAEQAAAPIGPELQQALAQAQQMLGQLNQTAGQAGQIAEPNLAMMDPNSEHYNPEQFIREKAFYDHAQQQQHAAVSQRHALAEQIRQQQTQLLATKWPEYTDPVKGEAVRGQARTMLTELGYTPQEMEMMVDHRFGLLVRDAMSYRELKSGVEQTKRKLKGKPKRAVRTGEVKGPQYRASEQQRAMTDRAAQSGSLDDVFAKRQAKQRAQANGGKQYL